MQSEIIDDTNRELVRKKTDHYLRNGWQKKGDLRIFTSFIPYEIKITKHHAATIYYQELIREDNL